MKVKSKIMLGSLGTGKYSMDDDGITASLISTYLNCRIKFLIAINQYTAVEQKSYAFGTLMHDLLEQIYVAEGSLSDAEIEESIDESLEMNREKFTGKSEEEIEKDAGVAGVMCRQYQRFYKKEFQVLKNLEPEHEFNTLWNGFRLRGKIDLRCEQNGLRKIWEHKNYSQISEDIMPDLLSYNFQNLFYLIASESETKKPIDKIEYNIVRAPSHRPGAGESLKSFITRLEGEVAKSPKHFFVRFPLVFTPAQRERLSDELTMILEEIQDFCEDNGEGVLHAYRNCTACESRKYHCAYISSCAAGYLIGCKKKDKLFSELGVAKVKLPKGGK